MCTLTLPTMTLSHIAFFFFLQSFDHGFLFTYVCPGFPICLETP